MKYSRCVACALLFAAGCGLVSAGPAERTGSTERLLAEPPTDWVRAYAFSSDDTRLVEFTPPEEKEGSENATIKVSFESFVNKEDVDPLEILSAEVARQREMCTSLSDYNLFSGFENNYPVSTRMILCGKLKTDPDTGEFNLFKAIKGDEYLYVIRIVKQVPTFTTDGADVAEQELAVWTAWLKRIGVCNSNDSEHPCPAT